MLVKFNGRIQVFKHFKSLQNYQVCMIFEAKPLVGGVMYLIWKDYVGRLFFNFFSLCFNPKSTTEWLTCQCLLTDYHPYRRGTASHQRETENGSESVTYFQEKAREYLEGKFVLCFSSLTHLGVCIYFLINFCLLIVQSRMHIVI